MGGNSGSFNNSKEKEKEMKRHTKRQGISVSARKAKGRKLQQWVMREISRVTGLKCGKDTLISSREMGQSGTDVRLIGEALDLFPFAVECKNQESWSIPKWIEQAMTNTKVRQEWLLVVKRNQMEPVIVMDAKRFFDLYHAYFMNEDIIRDGIEEIKF